MISKYFFNINKLITKKKKKNYKLKEGDYSINIKVIEATDLIPKQNIQLNKKDSQTQKNRNKGLLGITEAQICSSQVTVEVMDKKKTTKIIKEQSSPVYNQGWTFFFKNLKLEQLQDVSIKFTVFDKSTFSSSIIGSYEVDLTSVYFQPMHEYYHTWLTLTDPTDEVEGPTGYIFVNITVLGPDDSAAVHDISDAKKPTAGKENALVPQKINQQGHEILINIYRAENLPCLDIAQNSIDAYIVAKFGSIIKKTKVVQSRNPEWNQCIQLACMLPCQTKQITISVYDRDIGSEDDLVGQFKIDFNKIQGKKPIPQWQNLYGAPVCASGQHADLMNFYGSTLGSHYRGRLLYSVTSYNKNNPKTILRNLNFSFPDNPIPQTTIRTYILWIDILEGNEIPEKKNNEFFIHVSMGPYMSYSNKSINYQGQVNWNQSLKERKVIFPEDIEQIPDLIFYVADDNSEDSRICYNRLKASKILNTNPDFNPKTDHQTFLLELKEDRSLDLVKDDEFPGFLTVRVSLLKFRPKKGKEREFLQGNSLKMLDSYQLRVQLYNGKELPPADDTGGCDPFVKVKCSGKSGWSKVKQRTLNPGWYQSINIEGVQLPSIQEFMESKMPTKGIFLTLYDSDDNQKENGLEKHFKRAFNQQFQSLQQKFKKFYGKISGKKDDEENDDDNTSLNDKQKKDNKQNNNNSQISNFLVSQKQNDEELDLITENQDQLLLDDSGLQIADINKIDKDLLGRIWIPLEPTHVKFKLIQEQDEPTQYADILYRRPKWYPIKYDATGEYTGQVLLSYAIIPTVYQDRIASKRLFPRSQTQVLTFFIIGVRDIDFEVMGFTPQKLQASFDISGDNQQQIKTDKMKIKDDGANANKAIEMVLQVPNNKSFGPIIDVFLWDGTDGNEEEFLGYSSIKFNDFRSKKSDAGQEKEIDSEDTSIVDVLKQQFELEEKRQKELLNQQQEKEQKKNEKQQKEEYDEEMKAYRKLLFYLLQKHITLGLPQFENEDDENQQLLEGRQELKEEDIQIVNTFNMPSQYEEENKEQQSQKQLVQDKSTMKERRISLLESQEKDLSTFMPRDSLTFSIKSHSKKELTKEQIAQDGKLMLPIIKEDEEQDENKLLQKTARMFNIFKKHKHMIIQEYEDYDTDEDEDLDITPGWQKNREFYPQEFEKYYFPTKKLKCIDIMKGQSRGVKKNIFSFDKPSIPQKLATLKCIFIEKNKQIQTKIENLKQLMKEKKYICRVYITRGKNIGGEGSNLDTYLKLQLGSYKKDLKSNSSNQQILYLFFQKKETTLRPETCNPDYYICEDIECTLPGSAVLKIQVWDDAFGRDQLVGQTQIDMENRIFTAKWVKLDRKPFENRNLYPENETLSIGQLEIWVELIPFRFLKDYLPEKIAPPPKYEMELRVIVWETKDCVFKDEAEQCNDIFVRCFLKNQPAKVQETDVHWRCRANGSFNWRMKFRQTYPLTISDYGGDQLQVQLLDKDLVASNDIIGECAINLNQHKLIDKCVKRQKAVTMQMKELSKTGKIVDKQWYQVYNPLVRDKAKNLIPQGQVCLSIELIPVKAAEEKKNGLGRDAPNNFPPLPEPSGRLKFDIFHPFQFLKDIIGPNLYKKFCGIIIFVLCFGICSIVGWMLISQIIAISIVK
ncbi:hypothetical protein IMG5_151880 [Ichthyophthirius multifiliis]|uniref:C2 domain-containing protein n=1 Tax=Ichthyophthirius multifiliis TaxID=5932 RepID=G0QYS9_ICHMU|nr:hypothetical protein IMG5_151880 [Ichthyophthirius multifiliis]EGR29640.1 hypothetical protein IMG5_151880 [Ichthyophthirius multifiliis]|eukprot:XP_004030876.1 hypothetical protein IMG5_151880 [Ichthyophthirius multifiliis]